VSCEDQLNALPGQSKVDGNVIIDQKSALIALNGVYYRLANSGDDRGTLSTQWSSMHEILPSVLAGYLRYANGLTSFEVNSQVTGNDSGVATIWSYAYSLINAANGVIKQIEPLSNSLFEKNRKAEIIAEAQLLRAYGHYFLLGFFTQFYDTNSEYGLLIRDELVTTGNIAKKRSNVKDSYDFILNDIDEAIKHIRIDNPNYYANLWVAKGLKARVLILRGKPEDYTEIIRLTGEIIDSGVYELEPNVKDIFQINGLSSKEILFGTTPFPNQVNRHDTYAYNNNPSYLPTDSYLELLNNDPRKDWLIGTIGARTPSVVKYIGPKLEETYVLRLTEIYLLKSEAIIRSGGVLSEAKSFLKTILTHAGYTNLTSIDDITDRNELLYEVYKEYVRNLAFEDCIDWLALIRLPLDKILEIKPEISEKNYIILPIPTAEFEKNPTIGEQNPGYSIN
jgi:hypothetical protein